MSEVAHQENHARYNNQWPVEGHQMLLYQYSSYLIKSKALSKVLLAATLIAKILN